MSAPELRIAGFTGVRTDVPPTLLDPKGDPGKAPVAAAAVQAINVEARALPVVTCRLLPVVLNDGDGANTDFPRTH